MTFLTKLCNPLGDELDAQIRNAPLLNSIRKPLPDDRTFPLFPSLPKELRLKIWEEVTPRERVIHLLIGCLHDEDREVIEAPVRYLEKNHLGNPISGSPYWITMQDPRLHHPLLTVSREARQAVLHFYRIHLPIYYSNRSLEGPTTLYINPEHDVLQINAHEPVKQTLIDFLWDLKAYDPKGVGLLKLAMNLSEFCRNDLQYLKRSDLLLIRQRQVLIETLSQLQEVWFINMETVKNRYKRSTDSVEGVVPLGHEMVGFENVGLDTGKDAERSLQYVYLGSIDPRELIWRWKRLLRTWGIRHAPGQVKYRVILPQRRKLYYYPKTPGRLSRMMDRLTLREPYDWDAVDPRLVVPRLEDTDVSSPLGQVMPGATKTAAVGLWSFPVEAVGEIGEGESLSDLDFEPDRIVDLTKYWPELLLAKMACNSP